MGTYPIEFSRLEKQIEELQAENKRLHYENSRLEGTEFVSFARKTIAENERLKEWKKTVLGKIKRWPIYDAGKWAGDKEGWGYIFELIGWSEQERTMLQAKNEQLINLLRQEVDVGRADVDDIGFDAWLEQELKGGD